MKKLEKFRNEPLVGVKEGDRIEISIDGQILRYEVFTEEPIVLLDIDSTSVRYPDLHYRVKELLKNTQPLQWRFENENQSTETL